MVQPEAMRKAFLWEEERKVDKAGCVQLQGHIFDTGLYLARKKVLLRFDPLDLTQVEVFYKGVSHGVAKLLRMGERNGVVRRGKVSAGKPEGRGSAILQMMAEKERKRAQLDIGAFLLSKEEEPQND